MNERSFIYGDKPMRDGRPTREKIRQTALTLFVERGVDAVSLRDIADAVGIRASTIYVHWKSRDALVGELFVDGYASYARRIAAAIEGEAAFAAKLEAVVRLVCRLETEDPVLFRFLLLTQHGSLSAVDHCEGNPIDLLARLMRDGVATGIIAGDPDLLTAVVVGALVQPATFSLYGRIGRSLDQMADEIVGYCLKLVGAARCPPTTK